MSPIPKECKDVSIVLFQTLKMMHYVICYQPDPKGMYLGMCLPARGVIGSTFFL